ncbi:iron-containing redox enzyme family protein [Amycolatopsis sp. cmx-11-51]|uniref:iron-containing redox enzyme family protein n=1 Tax=Amycolatopsis sp. cmx-11-51 TaxID=2785797 RepID=UPI0039E56C3A
MTAAGLSDGYRACLDHVPARKLATVNMMSLFALHRSPRGALVGHFAVAEITTVPAARRMGQAWERLGGAAACRYFYTEHIEADAVHEQALRHDVGGDLLEDRLSGHLMRSWTAGESLTHPAAAVSGSTSPLPASDRGVRSAPVSSCCSRSWGLRFTVDPSGCPGLVVPDVHNDPRVRGYFAGERVVDRQRRHR